MPGRDPYLPCSTGPSAGCTFIQLLLRWPKGLVQQQGLARERSFIDDVHFVKEPVDRQHFFHRYVGISSREGEAFSTSNCGQNFFQTIQFGDEGRRMVTGLPAFPSLARMSSFVIPTLQERSSRSAMLAPRRTFCPLRADGLSQDCPFGLRRMSMVCAVFIQE